MATAGDVQQTELIRRIASVVGHELRNPMAVINNSAYFVKAKLGAAKGLDPKVEKHLGIIAAEIARADRMLADMLAYSRTLELAKTGTSLSRVVETALEGVDAGAAKLSVKKPKTDTALTADTEKLADAVRRLVHNALEAAPEGVVTVSYGAEKAVAFVEVSDTGPGVKAELRGRLFEPFRTGKPKGLGLGLALARKIVEAHGGKAEAFETPTRFRLSVPHG